MKEMFWCQSQWFWNHQLQEIEFQWTMLQTSPNRELFLLLRVDHTKKVDIDPQVFLHMQVSFQLISTCTELRFMTGAVVDILNSIHSAMVSASGSWQDLGPSPSMFQSPDTTSFVIARWAPMHHSVTELISKFLDGPTSITEDSGEWTPLLCGGVASATGCSHSTSDP